MVLRKSRWIFFLFFLFPVIHLISPITGISSYSCKEVWESINSNVPPLIIDTRQRESYINAHIPTAINIPSTDSINETIIQMISGFKKSEIITYCSCPEGSSAKNFAELLLENGIQNASYMHENFIYWPYITITGNSPGSIDDITSNFNDSTTNQSRQQNLINNQNFPLLIISSLFLLGISFTYLLRKKKVLSPTNPRNTPLNRLKEVLDLQEQNINPQKLKKRKFRRG